MVFFLIPVALVSAKTLVNIAMISATAAASVRVTTVITEKNLKKDWSREFGGTLKPWVAFTDYGFLLRHDGVEHSY